MVVVLSLSLLSGNRRARPLIAFLLRIVRVGLFFETLFSVILESTGYEDTVMLTSTGLVELNPSSSP